MSARGQNIMDITTREMEGSGAGTCGWSCASFHQTFFIKLTRQKCPIDVTAMCAGPHMGLQEGETAWRVRREPMRRQSTLCGSFSLFSSLVMLFFLWSQ